MADTATTRFQLPSGDANGPRFRTPFGFLAALRQDTLGVLTQCNRTFGHSVRIRCFPLQTFLFTDPRDVRYVLQENHRNYGKGILFDKLKRVGGEGLVFSDGDLWRRQRQLIQPAFQRQKIAAMADGMVVSIQRLLDRWAARSNAADPFDVAPEMSRLTLDIVAGAMFGTDLGADEDEFLESVSGALTYANHLMNHFFNAPLFIPTAVNRRASSAIRRLDRIVSNVLQSRRQSTETRDDLLAMLLTARDAETNDTMNDQQLRDEAVTFLVAGYETTAVALSWTWYLLSQNPDAERKLHAEVDEVLEGTPPTQDDLANLTYTRMVFEEAMRLYPPAWAMSRQAKQNDQVGGMTVRKRDTITLSQYVTHRHPDYWENPEHFDPERFTPEQSEGRPEYAYFPFGGGPRRCVGQNFAMMEGPLVIAMIAQRFQLRAVAGHPIELDPLLTLRPRHGIRMTMHPR